MLNLAAKELRVQSSKSFPQALERWWYDFLLGPKGCECPKQISLERFFCGLEQKRRPIIILVTGEADNGLRSEDNTVDEQNLA